MKKCSRIISLVLTVVMCLSCIPAAFAASVDNATIDEDQTGSLTIFKYDYTNANKDDQWDDSYVSTGVYDQNVNDALGGATREGDTDNSAVLGNGETSYGYAIKGVEFTYLRVADIIQFTESTADGRTDNHVEVLYGIDKLKSADLLKAIGLSDGSGRYENADSSDKLDTAKFYYQSDVLINSLRDSLEANASVVKNALENYVRSNGGTAMALTDAYGKTSADGLELGLYLLVETKVPEMVTNTTNPFFISLPMTSVDGTNATDGGTRWIYDVTVYPKNETGIPSLEKTLRENKEDTGKNNGSVTDIADGFAHTGTASAGDIIDYQIISTLPGITSEATYLNQYGFVDTLSAGLSYCREDVVLEFFSDKNCTSLITRWEEEDGKFTVSYSAADDGSSVMSIEMTEAGLAELNSVKTVYTAAGAVNSGYSNCTLRITYQAVVDSDNSVVFGDSGNPNEVVMTWKRTSTEYFDTLVDDAHVYTYGIDLTKQFSDGAGNYSKVEFVIYNETDGYFVMAELNEDEGIYYVTGHSTQEADATHFVPVNSNGTDGKVIVKGLEDDTYIITEVRTDNGYTLLKDDISVVISQAKTTALCDIYESDVLGLIQNDPRFAEIINGDVELVNIPQKYLEHHLLTASATVDGNPVNMLADNSSANAEAPLTVVNTRGFDLPQTGDAGTYLLSIAGIAMAASALAIIVLTCKKKETEQTAQQ